MTTRWTADYVDSESSSEGRREGRRTTWILNRVQNDDEADGGQTVDYVDSESSSE